jgi:hypothetical protein
MAIAGKGLRGQPVTSLSLIPQQPPASLTFPQEGTSLSDSPWPTPLLGSTQMTSLQRGLGQPLLERTLPGPLRDGSALDPDRDVGIYTNHPSSK